MATGVSPYDFLSNGLRNELHEAFERVPEARPLFESGKPMLIVEAEKKLRAAGFPLVASRVDNSMPNMYSI